MDGDPVEVGVELLAALERDVTLAEAVDRIETITDDPRVTRRILDAAEKRGVISRKDGVLSTKGGGFVQFDRRIVEKEGEFSCRRCGTELSTGYFLDLDAGELGPFGSSCIRKVTGRD